MTIVVNVVMKCLNKDHLWSIVESQSYPSIFWSQFSGELQLEHKVARIFVICVCDEDVGDSD